jgi:uncharacterized protein DUF6268
MRNQFVALSGLLVALGSLAAPAGAQQAGMWLDPRLGRLQTSAGYQVRSYWNEDVGGQDAEMAFTQHELSVMTPITQSERQEWALFGKFKVLDLNTGVKLPDTRSAFPEDLWDLRLGVTYRRIVQDDWLIGAKLGIGSASDAPFGSDSETEVSVLGFLRIPHQERNAWLFFLAFQTGLDSVDSIPLPGVGYHWVSSEKFQAVLGVPFLWARYRPVERLTLQASWRMLYTVNAEASYQIADDLSLYAAYDWDDQRFLREGRRDDDDRLYYYEQRVSGGLRWKLHEHASINVGGGYAFRRFWFEGEDYGDRDQNRFFLGDGPFLAAQVAIRF